MTNRSTTWCGCSRRGGLTLIEVVAAIAILGTVLVGIVIAKARHTHQLARAHRLDLAVGAADDLIAGWWLSEAGVPVAADGPIEGQPLMNWQTVVAPNAAIEQLGARVVRVSIRDAYDAETRRAP